MAATTISVCKFVGTVSLGLLTVCHSHFCQQLTLSLASSCREALKDMVFPS